jgi:predicted enzyme related to lactoylglutathione lyase
MPDVKPVEQPARLALGRFVMCLNVKDVHAALEFYTKLDFQKVDGVLADGWAIVEQNGVRLGLFQGHIPANLLNFRGGDVFALQHSLQSRGLKIKTEAFRDPKGCCTAYLEDPDGNVLMLETCPGETL